MPPLVLTLAATVAVTDAQIKNPINGMIAAYLSDVCGDSCGAALNGTAPVTLLIVDRTTDLIAALVHDLTYQVRASARACVCVWLRVVAPACVRITVVCG